MPGPVLQPNITMPQLQSNGWFPSGIPWAHYTGRQNPLHDDIALSYEGGNQAVMSIMVYRDDVFQAAADLLGSNETDFTNPFFYTLNGNTPNPVFLTLYNLNRQPPMVHPIMQWLVASRISSIKAYVTMTGDLGENEIDDFPPDKDAYPGANIPGLPATDIITTVPRFLIITVLFQQPKYRIIGDSDTDSAATPPSGDAGLWTPFGSQQNLLLRPEWRRYMEGWPRPKTEFVNQEARTMYFLETGSGIDSNTGLNVANPGPGGGVFQNLTNSPQPPNAAGVSFPSPWPTPLKKAELVLKWKRVPQNGLLDAYGKPRILDLALQTVNAVTIFDRPPGTLKFEGYDLQPQECPIQPGLVANPPITSMANLYFDVVLSWSFFDPNYDVTSQSDPNGYYPGGTPTRGHNLGPWRGSVAGDKTGNLIWYKLGSSPPPGPTPKIGDGGPLLFQFFDHRLIFCMNA